MGNVHEDDGTSPMGSFASSCGGLAIVANYAALGEGNFRETERYQSYRSSHHDHALSRKVFSIAPEPANADSRDTICTDQASQHSIAYPVRHKLPEMPVVKGVEEFAKRLLLLPWIGLGKLRR
jgi:hypothetical protein